MFPTVTANGCTVKGTERSEHFLAPTRGSADGGLLSHRDSIAGLGVIDDSADGEPGRER
jgi:hypothetical protein